jgi:hypothetical protein
MLHHITDETRMPVGVHCDDVSGVVLGFLLVEQN